MSSTRMIFNILRPVAYGIFGAGSGFLGGTIARGIGNTDAHPWEVSGETAVGNMAMGLIMSCLCSCGHDQPTRKMILAELCLLIGTTGLGSALGWAMLKFLSTMSLGTTVKSAMLGATALESSALILLLLGILIRMAACATITNQGQNIVNRIEEGRERLGQLARAEHLGDAIQHNYEFELDELGDNAEPQENPVIAPLTEDSVSPRLGR